MRYIIVWRAFSFPVKLWIYLCLFFFVEVLLSYWVFWVWVNFNPLILMTLLAVQILILRSPNHLKTILRRHPLEVRKGRLGCCLWPWDTHRGWWMSVRLIVRLNKQKGTVVLNIFLLLIQILVLVIPLAFLLFLFFNILFFAGHYNFKL